MNPVGTTLEAKLEGPPCRGAVVFLPCPSRHALHNLSSLQRSPRYIINLEDSLSSIANLIPSSINDYLLFCLTHVMFQEQGGSYGSWTMGPGVADQSISGSLLGMCVPPLGTLSQAWISPGRFVHLGHSQPGAVVPGKEQRCRDKHH